jgi:hypothetical protein
VGGTRPLIGLDQVRAHLGRFYEVQKQQVSVRRYGEEDFLLVFTEARVASCLLLFHRWRRQAGALFSPLRFKVLLVVSNLSGHIWSGEVVQSIMGSSSLVFEPTPQSVVREDLSHFYVVDPVEVGCIVSVSPPLPPGIRAHTLEAGYTAVLEVHDFSIPGVDISEDSSSETTHGLTRVEARVCTDPGIGFSIMSLASRHPGKLGLPYC